VTNAFFPSNCRFTVALLCYSSPDNSGAVTVILLQSSLISMPAL
jgi:hypothetical protein